MYNIRQKLVFQQVSVDLNKHIMSFSDSDVFDQGQYLINERYLQVYEILDINDISIMTS